MAFTTKIQILKVNPLREGIGGTSKKPYRMQDAECMLVTDDGECDAVGVLMLPKDMVGDQAPKPGVYSASFALRANSSKDGGRKIEAYFTALTRVPS